MTNLKIYRRMHVPWPWFVYAGLIVFILRRSWPHERKTQHFSFKNKRQSWCACPFDSQTLGGACATTKCAPSAFSEYQSSQHTSSLPFNARIKMIQAKKVLNESSNVVYVSWNIIFRKYTVILTYTVKLKHFL